MTQEEKLRSYRDALEREEEKQAVLQRKLEEEQQKNGDLETKLERIKGSKIWKMSKPLRDVMHFMMRTKERLGYYGSLKGIARKLNAKMIEKKARRQHGTASFPNAQEAERQKNTVFDRDVTFSILVPLYNTPEKFLRQAIESVISQTYPKWQLCLADGSDEAHATVGKICQEYADKDDRITYQKLSENKGISGNTNACLAMAREIILHCLTMMTCSIRACCMNI